MAYGRRGPAPKPVEEKRRIGNPGHRPLPVIGALVPIAGTGGQTPEPPRPLERWGRDLWSRVWTAGAVWLARDIDLHAVLILCEQVDEREHLRASLAVEPDWRERAALRVLDKQIMVGLGSLGFNPSERSRMQVAEVTQPSRLEQLLAERKAR